MYIDRGEALSAWSMEIAFRKAKLSGAEIKAVSDMTRQLGLYMVMDRDMLQTRVGYQLCMRFFRKAINIGLITELADHEAKKFYFQVGPSGYYLLSHDRYPYIKLPLSTDHEDRGRILAFNKWAIRRNIRIIPENPSGSFSFFFCANEIVAYYPKLITQKRIEEVIMDRKNKTNGDNSSTEKDINYKFVRITEEPVYINSNIVGTVKFNLRNRVRALPDFDV